MKTEDLRYYIETNFNCEILRLQKEIFSDFHFSITLKPKKNEISIPTKGITGFRINYKKKEITLHINTNLILKK